MFARTCQECLHIQVDKEPAKITDKWLEKPCRKCKSSALDYGHDGFTTKNGKIVKKVWEGEE